MKITKRQLRRIIKEEKDKLLREARDTGGASPLIDFASAYAGLGSAVQEQVVAVVEAMVQFGENSPEFEDAVYSQNPNAIEMAQRTLLSHLNGMAGEDAEDLLTALETAEEIIRNADGV
jgi:hypothetical protein